MAEPEDSIDEALQQAEDLEDSESSEEPSPPPKKKRKLDKDRAKSKRSKRKEVEESNIDVEFTPEDLAADSVRRKELRKIKMKHPDLDISHVLKTTEEIASMTPEEVINVLESSKVTIGLRKPLAEAENIVGLMALVAQRYFKTGGDLYSRFMSDTELIAAVDEFTPRLSEEITGPMGILVRAAGHISDSSYRQNNFSNASSRGSETS